MNKKNLKKKNGFTLLEVIVVLVILAILATILIPSLTGYIDKANERAVIAEARAALMAAQTLGTEKYAGLNTLDFTAAAGTDAVDSLAEVKGETSALVVTDGKVVSFTYTAKGGKVCTYSATRDPQFQVQTTP